MEELKNKNRFMMIIENKAVIFLFAFSLMMILMTTWNDPISASNDAMETWKITTTFFSSTPYAAYVMYKGILAFIPTVISYQLSLLFNTDQFFFFRIFNSAIFAYIAVIGVPGLFKNLFNKEVNALKRYLLSIFLFMFIGKFFMTLSVDAPSLAILLLMLNLTFKMFDGKKHSVFLWLWLGILYSMCALFSGQYILAPVLGIVYIGIASYQNREKISTKKIKVIFSVLLFLVGFFGVRIVNEAYIKYRVEPAREAGVFLPNGEYWLKSSSTNGLTRMNMDIKTVPNIIGLSILKNHNLNVEAIKEGSVTLTTVEYFKLALKHPIEFVVIWSSKLFMGVSVGDIIIFTGGVFRPIYYNAAFALWMMYSFIYLNFVIMKKNVRRLKQLFSKKLLLVLSMILPSLVPCLMHVEMRYFMSIQVLIIGTVFCSDLIYDTVKEKIGKNKIKTTEKGLVNYNIVFYFLFIIMCFMLYLLIYAQLGPAESLLLK